MLSDCLVIAYKQTDLLLFKKQICKKGLEVTGGSPQERDLRPFDQKAERGWVIFFFQNQLTPQLACASSCAKQSTKISYKKEIEYIFYTNHKKILTQI